MLILHGLTDSDAPLSVINAALDKFENYESRQDSASGLVQASDAVPGVGAVGPVAKFHFSGKPD